MARLLLKLRQKKFSFNAMAENTFNLSRRIYTQLNASNNDESPIKLASFSITEHLNRDFQLAEKFYESYGWFTENTVFGLMGVIKISVSTLQRARISDTEDKYSTVEKLAKRESLYKQAKIYLDLMIGKQTLPLQPGLSGIPLLGNIDVIETVQLLNIADDFSWALGSKLTDESGKMYLEEDDILYARIRNAGYGLLGQNDKITITGSINQKIDCFYRHHIISQYKQGVHF